MQVFENKELTIDEMERNEIIELNKNIEQLKGIFMNVENLVVQQGDIIDRIDVNIEQTMNFVEGVGGSRGLIGRGTST